MPTKKNVIRTVMCKPGQSSSVFPVSMLVRSLKLVYAQISGNILHKTYVIQYKRFVRTLRFKFETICRRPMHVRFPVLVPMLFVTPSSCNLDVTALPVLLQLVLAHTSHYLACKRTRLVWWGLARRWRGATWYTTGHASLHRHWRVRLVSIIGAYPRHQAVLYYRIT
jgi:hypothetical protein